MKIFLFVLALFCLAMPLFAQEAAFRQLSAAKLQQLSQEKIWQQLLVMDEQSKSTITNQQFFLSATGAHDPYQELLATLEAFSSVRSAADDHPQCRFRGRFVWLSRQIDFSALGIQTVACPEYDDFAAQHMAQSVSIIFATGYLGNPASYYGHLLLKINSPLDSKTTSLENTAVNFGANVPPKENMVFYIVKGIFGGYDSSFTHQRYYYHSHNYGESELRDLWEYELDIENKDRELLIAHLWELMGAHYTYYFFNRNCAYRMGELLQLVIDKRLVEKWRPWETPQAIVQRIAATQYKGRPLVKALYYHPSRQSRLYQRYALLDAGKRNLVHSLVKKPAQLDESLKDLTLSEQYKVVDTLIDYYQFVRDEKSGAADTNNERYREILSKRYLLPPGDVEQLFSSNNQPHLGRKPSYLNIGVNSDGKREKFSVWLRPAYYDSLDAGYGHIQNAALSMGEIKMDIGQGDVDIRELNIVKIESLRRNFTGLPGDRKGSWYLEAGAERETIGCTDCLATKFRSGYGYASGLWNDRVLLAGFVGGGFLDKSLVADGLYASALASLHVNLRQGLGLQIKSEQRYFDNNRNQDVLNLQARWQFSEQQDVRLFFEKNKEKEYGLSVGFYW